MHTHAHHWGRLKRSYAIIMLTCHFTCSMMSALVICKYRKKHDPTWHRIKLTFYSVGLAVAFGWELGQCCYKVIMQSEYSAAAWTDDSPHRQIGLITLWHESSAFFGVLIWSQCDPSLNIHVYSPDISMSCVADYDFHPWYWSTFFCSLISFGENSAQRLPFHQVPTTTKWTEAAWIEKLV